MPSRVFRLAPVAPAHTAKSAAPQGQPPPNQESLEELYIEAANADRKFFEPSPEVGPALVAASTEVCDSIDESSSDEYRRWIAMFARVPKLRGKETFVDDFRRTARKVLPKFRGYTVSDFCSWVYELHGVPYLNQALLRGVRSELTVFASRIRPPQRLGWQLIHNGMGVDSQKQGAVSGGLPAPCFQISSLRIRGEPLRGSPDLIFRRQDKSNCKISGREDIVMLEIKCTDAPLPIDLWPNLRCQLWAYSMIDDFADAEKLYLAAEVWTAMGTRQRCTVSWRRDDQKYNAECNRLFQLYSSLAVI